MKFLRAMSGIVLGESRYRHLVFVIAFIVIFSLPAALSDLPANKLFSVFLYSSFLVVCIYCGRLCCKRWLLESRFQQFLKFSLGSIICLGVAGSAGLTMLTNNSPVAILITAFVCTISFFLLGVFLSVTRAAILRQLKEARSMQEQKQSELRLLQTQLSPHFLFNTLNNLYGVSIVKHELVPGLLLKLSGLLRYSIYGSKESFVPLISEIEYIDNYIEFEKMRVSDRLELNKFIAAINDQSIKIAPLLLIVFIENAFKHARNTLKKKIFIDISLEMKEELLFFSVSNSYGNPSMAVDKPAMNSGFGLENVTRRLNLLYENKYKLDQRVEDGIYKVILSINLN